MSYPANAERILKVIRLRLGMHDDRPPMTLAETGRAMGVSPARARQLQMRCIRWLESDDCDYPNAASLLAATKGLVREEAEILCNECGWRLKEPGAWHICDRGLVE